MNKSLSKNPSSNTRGCVMFMYTIFHFDIISLQEPLKWAVLKGDQKIYSMTVTQKEKQSLLFGISMETESLLGETVSSGILWNDCIYMKNKSKFLNRLGLESQDIFSPIFSQFRFRCLPVPCDFMIYESCQEYCFLML